MFIYVLEVRLIDLILMTYKIFAGYLNHEKNTVFLVVFGDNIDLHKVLLINP